MTVPGGKIAAAPPAAHRLEILRRDDAADHDHDVGPRPRRHRVATEAGTSVRWPAASDETPSDVHVRPRSAWRAASAGVANSGPSATSKPRSAKAEAITFWPRSWPSWPTLATRMRGRPPVVLGEAPRQVARRARPPRCPPASAPIDAGDHAARSRAWRPKAGFQRGRDLADRGLGARRLDASASRLPLPSRAAGVSAASAACDGRRVALGPQARRAWRSARRGRRNCRPSARRAAARRSGGSG